MAEPPGRVGECQPGHQRRRPTRAELPDQRVGAEQRAPESQHEEDVVPEHRRGRPGTDEPERRVAEQRVRVGQRVLLRERDVRVPQPGRIVQQRVPDPRHLPGLQGGVVAVLRDRRHRVLQGRPGHRGGQGDRAQRGEHPFVPDQGDRAPAATHAQDPSGRC